ncbi:MAG: starch-binding protein, partial [Oscillospiraceae bacterium]|nr:starch-binding protein [Oscillospiraceae bacterium]
MRTSTKRLLSIMLCLALVMALLPAAALAFSEETVTIYFDNSVKKWSKVNAYYWNSKENNSWPGTAMTQVDDTTWSIEVPTDAVNIIFNNGSGSQTANLTVPTDGKNIHNGTAWGTYGGEFEEVEMETVYIDLAAMNWTSVNAYIWVEGGGPVNGAWPGDAMTLVEGSIYSVSIVAGSGNMIIFNDGTNQTGNLAWPGDGMIWNGAQFVDYATYNPDEEVVVDYYVAGTMTEWISNDANYLMTETDGVYTLSMDLEAGDYQLKVAGSNGVWYPEGYDNNVVFSVAEAGTVTVTFTPADGTVKVTGDCLGETTEPDSSEDTTTGEDVVTNYYVTGSFNGWVNGDENYIMTADDNGVYHANIAVEEPGNVSLKVTTGSWDPAWGGTGENGNYEFNMSVAGTATVNFDPTTGVITISGYGIGDVVKEDIVIDYIAVVGDEGLTGADWELESNKMILVDGVYTATFSGVAAGTYQFKFAANGAWTHNWASGIEIVSGETQTAWHNAQGNSSVVVPEGYTATITMTLDTSAMDATTGEGCTMVVTVDTTAAEEGGDTEDPVLTLGNNDIEMPGGTQDGITTTFTAESDGELVLTVVGLSTYDEYSASWSECPADFIPRQFMMGMIGLNVNGNDIGNYTHTMTVAKGDVVSVKFYSFQGVQAKIALNVELNSSGSEVDPEPVPDEFYLFGYINGANYGCEEDSENLGEYKFVDGTLVATFDVDSYVAVKTNNGAWYMTNGWLGEGVTSATLYTTDITGENSNKLMVPGGVEITFTMTVNEDGSLTLNAAYEAPVYDFYLAGSMTGWKNGLEEYKLVDNSITLTLKKGDYEFKITNGTWDKAWPAENYALSVSTYANVTISIDPVTYAITVTEEAIQV